MSTKVSCKAVSQVVFAGESLICNSIVCPILAQWGTYQDKKRLKEKCILPYTTVHATLFTNTSSHIKMIFSVNVKAHA